MVRYIALLRGINVGSHSVKMEQLREHFVALGLHNVRSYINSGNVFFDTDNTDREGLTKTIETYLHSVLGFEVLTFLRTTAELESILAQDPFAEIELTDSTRFCVIFTKEPLPAQIALPQHSTKDDMDLIGYNSYEAFVVWHIINGRPPSGKFPQGIIDADTSTTRFYHTLAKILASAQN